MADADAAWDDSPEPTALEQELANALERAKEWGIDVKELGIAIVPPKDRAPSPARYLGKDQNGDLIFKRLDAGA